MAKFVSTRSSLVISASPALITAALLTAPLSAEVTHPNDGSSQPGDFTVGPWTGSCVRDGWLNGAKNESCGAQLTAEGRTIYLVRTMKQLVVTLNVSDCGPEVFKTKINANLLAQKGRAARLKSSIESLFKKEDQKCGDPAAWAVPITREDLADILKETDGLNF